MDKHRKVIITGSQGTGKTSLLNALSGTYCTVDEVSREIIAAQQKANLNATPWGDVEQYANLVFRKMHAQYKKQDTKLCIYDRAMPDLIAYLKFRKKKVPINIYHSINKYLQNPVVFFAPIWEDIYIKDLQRPENFEATIAISSIIKTTYLELGFELIELKKESVKARKAFIENTLSTQYKFLF